MSLPLRAALTLGLALSLGAGAGGVRAPRTPSGPAALHSSNASAAAIAEAECPRATGSYTETCSNCGVSAYPDCLLKCQCQDADGRHNSMECYHLRPEFRCKDSEDYGEGHAPAATFPGAVTSRALSRRGAMRSQFQAGSPAAAVQCPAQ